MSIAGELVTIAENTPKVYEAGKNSVPNPLEYATNVSYSTTAFPDGYELILNIPKVSTLSYLLAYTTGVKKVTIKGNKDGKALDFSSAFWESSVEVIDATDFVLIPTKLDYTWRNASSLREIKGVIDFSQCATATHSFYNCEKLEEFRLLPNSVQQSFDIRHSPLLSAETIQSIIDGLVSYAGTDTSVSIYVHSNIIAKATDEQKIAIISKNWSVLYYDS